MFGVEYYLIDRETTISGKVYLRSIIKILFFVLIVNPFLAVPAQAGEDLPGSLSPGPLSQEESLRPETEEAGTVPVPPPFSLEDIFSDKTVPQTVIYQVQPGDTLAKIAARHHTTTDLIKISNHLASDMIYVGERLRVWTEPFSIVISKTENILLLQCAGKTIKRYVVATGIGNNTPTGEFTITSRLENPVWYKKGRGAILPDDPENPLGTRWLGFDKPQYGIHGTIYPELIGQQVSHGCVRMLNEDVEELYSLIPIGTRVLITDDPLSGPEVGSTSDKDSVE